MTRAAVNDAMQGFRFHAVATRAGDIGGNPLNISRDDFAGGNEAGFQSITIPELNVEAVEYREGTFKWTQKYPGPPTVGNCTLIRGVIKKDTKFFDWVKDSVDGQEYRCDVVIYHYQRTEMDSANIGEAGTDFRRLECRNCIPTRAKPMGDFDSTSGEVSMAEVDFEMESFVVKHK